MSTPNSKPTLEKISAPDPEDDLDDLDDVLDQFSSGSKAPPPTSNPNTYPSTFLSSPTATFANPGRPRQNTRVDAPPTSLPGSSASLVDHFAAGGAKKDGTLDEIDEDELSAAFARELSKGMESLMRDIVRDAPKDADEGTSQPKEKGQGENKEMSEEERKAFKAAWEAMLIEGMDAQMAAGGPALAGKQAEGAQGGGAFQDKIKQAMDKLKESESKFQGSSGAAGPGGMPTPESLEALLQSLGSLDGLGLGEEGEGGPEEEKELAGFLETMMGQLLSKDVLYDPLKELSDGFPKYLESPPAPLSSEDRQRYEKQQACVKNIVTVFEKSDYTDAHAEYSKQIVDLMSEMQSYGSPPAEIMGPLPAGFDGLDKLGDENCVVA